MHLIYQLLSVVHNLANLFGFKFFCRFNLMRLCNLLSYLRLLVRLSCTTCARRQIMLTLQSSVDEASLAIMIDVVVHIRVKLSRRLKLIMKPASLTPLTFVKVRLLFSKRCLATMTCECAMPLNLDYISILQLCSATIDGNRTLFTATFSLFLEVSVLSTATFTMTFG